MAAKTEAVSDLDPAIARALRVYEEIYEREADNRADALEDIRFTRGEQWPEAERKRREADDRPCITINRVQQMVKQVCNDMRQNRAAIRLLPARNGATVEAATIRSNLIRAIEAQSSASDAYSSAGEHAVMSGAGYLRVLPEYEEMGFDQRLRVKRIQNPLSVFYGACTEPDGSDATDAFLIDKLPREEFQRLYPKAKEVPFPTEGAGESWSDEDSIQVAEHFQVEEVDDTIYQFPDGTIAALSEMPGEPPEGSYLRTREVRRKQSVWRKMTAVEVLEEATYPIPFLLLIPVWGEEYNEDGKIYRMGIVRHAKDPQRVYNYSRTSGVEQVSLAPRAPYILAEGQVEGHEQEWGEANTKNHAYLTYSPVTIAGQTVPLPQRQAFAGVPAGAMSDLQLASEEIKATTGIYDASLGAKGNETSGKAILARQREADNATFHYPDNLNRAIKLVGRVLNALIPIIYDTPRTIQLLADDGQESTLDVNGDGQVDIRLGDYEVVMSVGPSYETKRVEAANSMTEFMKAIPDAAPLIADLIAQNMDWIGAPKIAERLKFMLPPEVRQAEDQGANVVPPEIQAKVQEMQQVIQQLQQAMQEQMQANQELEQKLAQEQGQLEIDGFRAQTERMTAVAEAMRTEDDGATEPTDEAENAPVVEALQGLAEHIDGLWEQLQAMQQPAVPAQPVAPVPQIVHVMQQAPPKPAQRTLRIQAPSGTIYEGHVAEDAACGLTVSLAEIADQREVSRNG